MLKAGRKKGRGSHGRGGGRSKGNKATLVQSEVERLEEEERQRAAGALSGVEGVSSRTEDVLRSWLKKARKALNRDDEVEGNQGSEEDEEDEGGQEETPGESPEPDEGEVSEDPEMKAEQSSVPGGYSEAAYRQFQALYEQ
ncbi:hypothetical protein V7S43_004895 [Phytophthora oleae]|uniref:Uncharacterized protein n=1 Tax=Phytophthora oleae TaxID=2107226 RepID=A0ABD3FV15_9STRA